MGAFAQGMVVSVPLHYERDLTRRGRKAGGEALHAALVEHYADSTFVEVMPFGEAGAKDAELLERGAFLRPDVLNDTNKLQVRNNTAERQGTARHGTEQHGRTARHDAARQDALANRPYADIPTSPPLAVCFLQR